MRRDVRRIAQTAAEALAGGGAEERRRRHGVRARVQGRRFREEEEKLCETDAWGPRKVK